MSFSYSGDPASSDQDAVRFYVHDTVDATHIVEDEEILFVLSGTPNVKLAAADVADTMRAHFARLASFKVGDISKDLTKAAQEYAELADDLRRSARTLAGVSFPATKVSTKQVLEDNTDLTDPKHTVGQGDNRRALQLDRENQLDDPLLDG